MEKQLAIITALHVNTKRDYLKRMIDNKIECMKVAGRYDKDFWDGDRRYGYGGYKYDGRWAGVAQNIIDIYGLSNESSVLDIGCGKGFLLYELKKILPGLKISGFDLSQYAIDNAKEEIKPFLFKKSAQDKYSFKDKEFDLVISLNTLHNLSIYDLKSALGEIQRVGKNKYIVVESFRDEKELFNLQCWALTCQLFFSPASWQWLFKEFGYSGDYEFIFFT